MRGLCSAVWLYLGLVAALVLPHHPGSWGRIAGGLAFLVGIGFGIAAWRGSEREVTGTPRRAVPCHRAKGRRGLIRLKHPPALAWFRGLLIIGRFGSSLCHTVGAAVKGKALRRPGVLLGLLAGPFFLVSVALNTWASLDYLRGLGWEFVGGEQVPWPSSPARAPYAWPKLRPFVVTGLLIVVLAVAVCDQLPHRRAGGVAVGLLALLGVALILAAFRVDVPMLSGGNPHTRHGWMHAIAFLLIIAMGVLALLTMALAVRGDPGWWPMAVVSVAASALFVVFLFLPWGNATFVLAIVTLFAWMAAIAVRLATHQQSQQDQQAT